MSDRSIHPGDEDLLRFADAELPAGEAEPIDTHLRTCPDCRARLEEARAGLDEYVRFHQDVLKPSLPPPPRAWADIRQLMSQARPERPRVVFLRSPRAWLAAAAALLICFAVARRFQQPPKVSAAELLRKASAAETAKPGQARPRIRIKTRRHTLLRAASVRARSSAAGESELRALFAEARFDWEDPLTAASFAAWRDTLPEKRDEVTVEANPAAYLIRTTTDHGALASATLSLRMDDLRPVRETLHFRNDEFVEISEAPGEAAPEPPAAPPPPPVATAPPASASETLPPPASRELHAVAALHGIGADLGEPVEVTRRGSEVVVTGTGLDAARREEVRQSLAGVPGVELRFDQPDSAPPQTAAAEQRPGATEREEFANRVLDASDAVRARAHALRSLAVRFPPDVEAQLLPADRALLAGLRREHLSALETRTAALLEILSASYPSLRSAPASGHAAAPANWQAGAQRILDAARELDRLLTVMLAGSGGVHEPELAGAAVRLRDEIGAAR